MKLKEFLELTSTYHFQLRIISKDYSQSDEYMFDDRRYYDKAHEEYEVIGIDCTTEVEQETLITHTIGIRPILLVIVAEKEQNI